MTSRSPFQLVLGVALALSVLATVGCKSKASSSEPPVPTIGVPVCDEYLRALYACMPQMAPDQRAAEQKSVDENLSGWRALSVKPANRAALEEGCTGSLQRLRETAPCNTK